MVHLCMVCNRVDHLYKHLSFHRFPQDPVRRKLWFSLVGIKETQPLTKNPKLCSDHFFSADLVLRPNGRRYIRKGANPRRCEGLIFLDDLSSSSDTTDFSSSPPPKKKLGISKLCLDSAVPVESPDDTISSYIQRPENITPSIITPELSVPGPSGIGIKDIEMNKGVSPSSTETASAINEGSTTETASEVGELLPSTNFNAPVIKKRKRRYIGDMASSDFSTPEKRKRNVGILKSTITKQRRKIHVLQNQVRRLKTRVKSLTELLKLLREKSLITESAETSIRASVTGPAADIFENLLKGKQRYNESLKAFALTLAFYSPRAYNFVRKTFNKSLPHLGTISTWYRSVEGSPGFSAEALNALQAKQKSANYPLLCNLVMDEMSIRRQVEWTGTKFMGYVDIGTQIEADVLPEAKEVLVFMLVCLNGAWKVPVGYFLLDGLAATEKANLVTQCLRFVHQSGVQVTSLTFDGAPVNLTMAEKLGAEFSSPLNLKTFFKHPVTNDNIYVFLDPCHMIKLVRNCFASQDGIKDSEDREIKWLYITELIELQKAEGLHAATKVRLRHLKWEREKMKVRLATQTISKSVSDAITFLREDLKNEVFLNSEGTSDFLIKFNNLFDILNARNRFNKYTYKRPLSDQTSILFFDYFDQMKEYIVGLTLKGRPIVKSARKTGFLGFLICMESLKHMYMDLVEEKGLLKYILSYKLSQDHLELFFGAIRSKGGHNNNPTARQFEAAFKRLLVHAQITAPETGNATNLENITILTSTYKRTAASLDDSLWMCGSDRVTTSDTGQRLEETEEYSLFLQNINEEIESNFIGSNAWDLTVYSQDIVAYIAGYVVKSLRKCVCCSTCSDLLESPSSAPSFLLERKKYAWDQSQKFVKFYVTLPKVNTVPAENVQCDFQEKTLELKVKNLENKDYVFKVTQLLYTIEPANSTYKVKNDLILINAAKKEDVHWSHVTEWEKKASDKKMPSFDNDDKSDPSASLMSIMRNMYETGDDQMKRTIAKAWTESQDKGKGPAF